MNYFYNLSDPDIQDDPIDGEEEFEDDGELGSNPYADDGIADEDDPEAE